MNALIVPLCDPIRLAETSPCGTPLPRDASALWLEIVINPLLGGLPIDEG
jgi:hypothetical protein